MSYRLVNVSNKRNSEAQFAFLRRKIEGLGAAGADVGYYQGMKRGDLPLHSSFVGTVGELDVQELLSETYGQELKHSRYPDFTTSGRSFEVWTPHGIEVQRKASLLSYFVAQELLRERGAFTQAIYSKSMSNPLVRFDVQPLRGGNLLSGGELLIDNRQWQHELAEVIYKKVKEKGHKNMMNRTHSSIVVNLSRLTCVHPLILARLLESMFKPGDSSIDSVLLAAFGQGDSMRFVHVRNRHADSPLEKSELGKLELTELDGHPFLYCFPTLIKHDATSFDFMQGRGGSLDVMGTEVNNLTLDSSLTLISAIGLNSQSSLSRMVVKSGKVECSVYFN